ncbi:MAG: HAD hydrolase-like protein [Nanoarchaeota archaeon]|nr:HAD hydrolase-like protein [Nanoarchaeota archaeon]
MVEITKVILDFDGTLTDVEKEAKPALAKKGELFCERTGMSRDLLDILLEKIKREVIQDPTAGWTNDGIVVASATADPYVLDTVCYFKLLEKLKNSRYDIPREQESREGLLQELFHESYPYAITAFREGAKELLETLEIIYEVAIVTNSRTDSVMKKLNQLGKFETPVIGGAKKYDVKERYLFTSVPEFIQPEGFPRLVFLRRKKYKDVLDGLEGFKPENTAVVGDIFELDLVLPQYVGYRTILLETPGTQVHEKPYMKSQPNSFLAKSFGEIMKFLKE